MHVCYLSARLLFVDLRMACDVILRMDCDVILRMDCDVILRMASHSCDVVSSRVVYVHHVLSQRALGWSLCRSHRALIRCVLRTCICTCICVICVCMLVYIICMYVHVNGGFVFTHTKIVSVKVYICMCSI